MEALVTSLEGRDALSADDLVSAIQEVFTEGRVLDYYLGADMDGATTYLVVDRANVFTSFMDQLNFVLENPFVTLNNFYGEFGVDHVGPRMEFFNLLVNYVQRYLTNLELERFYDTPPLHREKGNHHRVADNKGSGWVLLRLRDIE